MNGVDETDERVFTLNLKRVWDSSGRVRAPKSVRLVRELAARHLKTNPGSVKISDELNRFIWSRGLKHPPRRVRVKAERVDENVYMLKLIG